MKDGQNGVAKQGWSQVPHSITDSKELTGFDKLVWLGLRRFSTPEGICFPSYEALADLLGISRRQVILCVNHLEECKFVQIERHAGKSRPNTYRLLGVQDMHPSEFRGAGGALGGAYGAPLRGAGGAPEQEPEEQEPLTRTNGRPRRPLFDALAEVTGSDPKVSGSYIAKIEKLLKSAEPPYTPEEVRKIDPAMRRTHPWYKGPLTLGVIERYVGVVRIKPTNGYEDQYAKGKAELDAIKAHAKTLFEEKVNEH